jgi:RNA polymerase sigma factor (sigma-70 family)
MGGNMRSQQGSDRLLIESYLAGNQSGLEELIQKHKNQVFSYIIKLVRDQQLAEDIFQDTFIKVIKSLHEGCYKEKNKFASWATRIAHNLIMTTSAVQRNHLMLSTAIIMIFSAT